MLAGLLFLSTMVFADLPADLTFHHIQRESKNRFFFFQNDPLRAQITQGNRIQPLSKKVAEFSCPQGSTGAVLKVYPGGEETAIPEVNRGFPPFMSSSRCFEHLTELKRLLLLGIPLVIRIGFHPEGDTLIGIGPASYEYRRKSKPKSKGK